MSMPTLGEGMTYVDILASKFTKHTLQGNDVSIENHPLYIIVSMS